VIVADSRYSLKSITSFKGTDDPWTYAGETLRSSFESRLFTATLFEGPSGCVNMEEHSFARV